MHLQTVHYIYHFNVRFIRNIKIIKIPIWKTCINIYVPPWIKICIIFIVTWLQLFSPTNNVVQIWLAEVSVISTNFLDKTFAGSDQESTINEMRKFKNVNTMYIIVLIIVLMCVEQKWTSLINQTIMYYYSLWPSY